MPELRATSTPVMKERQPGPATAGEWQHRQVVAVPVLSIRPGVTPRLAGEDRAHIARLAEIGAPLPPILVDRRTMRVIDGMHRLMAASLRGQETIEVEFFEGSPAEAFLQAVKANVTHGFPLSRADRRAAALRIIQMCPQMSDGSIAEVAGLASTTVATMRRESAGPVRQPCIRIGKDGRARPVNGADGRLRAAAVLSERPDASAREVARAAGVSPATAWDVRKRLQRGEPPVPVADSAVVSTPAPRNARQGQPEKRPLPGGHASVLENLMRDPSLRSTDRGRQLLRLMQFNAAGVREWSEMATAVPPHRVAAVCQLARHYAQFWSSAAHDLAQWARVVDPARSTPPD